MTQRQAKLIDERKYMLKRIEEYRKQNPERTNSVIASYSIGELVDEHTLMWMPDSILETIIGELGEDDGR